jgi:hypothetical protein
MGTSSSVLKLGDGEGTDGRLAWEGVNVRAVGVGDGGSRPCPPACRCDEFLGGVEGTTDMEVARRGCRLELDGRDPDEPAGTNGLDRRGNEFILVGLKPPTRPVGEEGDPNGDDEYGCKDEDGELAPNGELDERSAKGDDAAGEGGDTNCKGREGRRVPEGRVGVPYMLVVAEDHHVKDLVRARDRVSRYRRVR